MKKLPFIIAAGVMSISPAFAAYSDSRFQKEILVGLDVASARASRANTYTVEEVVVDEEEAVGALGREVYESRTAAQSDDIRLFIPTSMYVRAGAGLNLGFATDKAKFNGRKYESHDSWTTQIGLGWNLSSYVRTEVDFQQSTFEFSGLDDADASYQTLGAMLYFDFARRYIMTGDVTRRRWFVPFMGIGAGAGYYKFNGTDGAKGFVVAAPRAELGLNIMLTDLIGVDVAYQYQLTSGRGFGWGVAAGGANNISNVMATFRVNF